MTILVTGACGFVGAHVAKALARRFPDDSVIAADLQPPPPEVTAFWGAARIAFAALDVTDRAAVASVVAAHRPRFVVHGAAMTPSAEVEAADPVRIVDVNLGGAVNVIDAATASPGIARVIAFSSAAVYGFGSAGAASIAEEAPLAGTGLYAVTKIACEGVLRRFGELRGVSTAAVRVAAVYGAMERPTGHRQRMSQVYPLFAALAAGKPIRVAISSGLRDWTDADDVGDSVAALLSAPRLNHPVYNVSHGVGVVWSDVIELFRAHGLTIEIVADPAGADVSFDSALGRPALAVERLIADTGFRPARRLEQAVARIAAAGKATS
jgi:UDP-glucose 4-epimerase